MREEDKVEYSNIVPRSIFVPITWIPFVLGVCLGVVILSLLVTFGWIYR